VLERPDPTARASPGGTGSAFQDAVYPISIFPFRPSSALDARGAGAAAGLQAGRLSRVSHPTGLGRAWQILLTLSFNAF
jgi:hypothetical protein